MEQPLFEVGPGEDPNHSPHRRQGRAQTGEPDPGRCAEVQPPVEAHGLGVHEEQVSLPEWLNFVGGGITDWQAGDTCSQDQETQGQGHLEVDRDRNVKK